MFETVYKHNFKVQYKGDYMMLLLEKFDRLKTPLEYILIISSVVYSLLFIEAFQSGLECLIRVFDFTDMIDFEALVKDIFMQLFEKAKPESILLRCVVNLVFMIRLWCEIFFVNCF